ncbi:ArnT family glycosyltransferase [Thiohalobacter thiocyanaticus]|uniref:Glycosyltransferase family 39 protein n=1 Tax=Thiohalobacter thiocyanaticus TaxID=585455 RepID=A0A426QKM6_9GAMM|nr:glycosyltransferase family 39 protein [Thiohalobacter thiocyanaticus]RRQ22315.1 glycosyltransferase family 39 protein [Thiohalobacter thiocyanaticus]
MRSASLPLRDLAGLLALHAGLMALVLWLRPLLPVDETRYVAVAWEMWLRGDLLVPHLNGEVYHHKPPLLFWLIQAGWALFGVNDWWPRLVAPLLALLNLMLAAGLARRLWPELPQTARYVPWLLLGLPVWAAFLTLVQFDLLLVACTLTGMLGLLEAAAGRRRGWGILGLAIGLGVLSKGPVILLHLLPAALLAPLWVARAPAWGRWYGALLGAVALGAVIALAWAVPAGIAGGEAYRDAIFWGQTAGRVVDSFAHRQPWWWYLPWLPLILLPWLLWRPLWRGASRIGWRGDWTLRFLLAWLLPVLLAFSLVSGKQIKYLLPLFPAAMLLLARLAVAAPGTARRPWLAAAILILGGGLLSLAPLLVRPGLAFWVPELPVWPGLALGGIGLLALALPPLSGLSQVRLTALATVLLIGAGHLAVLPAAAPAYDLRPAARRLAVLQAAGAPVAHVGKYHGQFQFPGRLQWPLTEVERAQAADWARTHPQGYLILYQGDWPVLDAGAVAIWPYRSEAADLALWRGADLVAALEAAGQGGGEN